MGVAKPHLFNWPHCTPLSNFLDPPLLYTCYWTGQMHKTNRLSPAHSQCLLNQALQDVHTPPSFQLQHISMEFCHCWCVTPLAKGADFLCLLLDLQGKGLVDAATFRSVPLRSIRITITNDTSTLFSAISPTSMTAAYKLVKHYITQFHPVPTQAWHGALHPYQKPPVHSLACQLHLVSTTLAKAELYSMEAKYTTRMPFTNCASSLYVVPKTSGGRHFCEYIRCLNDDTGPGMTGT